MIAGRFPGGRAAELAEAAVIQAEGTPMGPVLRAVNAVAGACSDSSQRTAVMLAPIMN